MKERSREIIKEALVRQLESLNMRLSSASLSIEMKERTIRNARSAGARTRARKELDVVTITKDTIEESRDALCDAILEFV